MRGCKRTSPEPRRDEPAVRVRSGVTDPRPTLTLAHSADADDVFMWWPICGKLDPAQPARVLEPARLDTGRFRFAALPEDIQALNARAIETGDLDITAVSIHAYPRIARRYALTACGWSFGDGFGPKLVARAGSPFTLEALRSSRPRIAVPGLQTTAFLVLSMLLGSDSFEPAPMRFDRIIDAVAAGEVEAGVLIHESQIDFESAGLMALADLGAWWKQTHGLPLPLGGNVVRRDLDDRFGPGALAEVGGLLQRSIRYALDHRAESLAYARTFSPPISDVGLDRYVSMYVSDLTVDARPIGLRAAETLFQRSAALGLGPDPGPIDLVG